MLTNTKEQTQMTITAYQRLKDDLEFMQQYEKNIDAELEKVNKTLKYLRELEQIQNIKSKSHD